MYSISVAKTITRSVLFGAFGVACFALSATELVGQGPFVRLLDAPLIRNEQSNWPRHLKFSDDGKLICYGDNDGQLYVLDVATGEQGFVCDGSQPNLVQPMAVEDFVVSKRQIAVVYTNCALALFKKSGQRIVAPTRFADGDNRITSRLSPKGKYIGVTRGLGDVDGTWIQSVEIYESKRGQLVGQFQLPGHPVCIEFRPDEKEFACVSGTNVHFYNLKGKPTREPIDLESGIANLRYSPDGKKILALGGDSEKFALVEIGTGDVSVNDTKVDKEDSTVHRFRSGLFCPDDKHFAVSTTAAIFLCDLATCEIVASRKCGSHTNCDYITISPDGKTLASTGRGRRKVIQLWNVDQLLEPLQFEHVKLEPFATDEIAENDLMISSAIEFSEQSDKLLMAHISLKSSAKNSNVEIWDLETAEISERFGDKTVAGITRIPNLADQYLVSRERNALELWDLSGANPVLSKQIPLDVKNMGNRISSDGKYVFLGKPRGGELREFSELEQPGKPLFDGKMRGLTKVGFTADSRFICGTDSQTVIRIYQTDTGKMIYETELPFVGLKDFAISPTRNELLFQGSDSDGIAILDIETLQIIRRIPLVAGDEHRLFTEAAYSPDGKFLLLGSSRGAVFMWDANTTRPLAKFEDHDTEDNVNKIVFSPDGKTLVTTANNNNVLVYSFDAMKEKLLSGAESK